MHQSPFARFTLLAIGSAIAIANVAAAADSASGSVRHADFEYRVVDGIAIALPEGGWKLGLSSEPYDRKAIAADGVDEFDIEQPVRDRKALVLELDIGADGGLEQVLTNAPGSGYGTKGAAVTKSLKLDRPPGDRLVGRVDLQDGDDRFDLRFDVAVAASARPEPAPDEARGEIEAASAPAPAAAAAGNESSGLAAEFRADTDTAAAAAVLFAHCDAVQYSNGKVFLASLTPDVAATMAQLEDPGVASMALSSLVSQYPYRTAVTGSERRGADEMELRFDALFNGKAVAGRAQMRRIEGRWYVVDATIDP